MQDRWGDVTGRLPFVRFSPKKEVAEPRPCRKEERAAGAGSPQESELCFTDTPVYLMWEPVQHRVLVPWSFLPFFRGFFVIYALLLSVSCHISKGCP